ncbi:ABC transporter membrane protein [Candidatus Photodesmus katoptron]|uniref:Binding-protein-dependent transport system inner membrane component n=2 Tax=Candidatus Photodesmus anomalopis TaxID=28176 RepID=S3DIC6_9GAMM|nr:binding-protein-dependent transport system inner membrane component [Candidatus Photodesmus katoptron Akat1]KEY90294.1 ABC transporter membrane protein [Candidatus Photodesmus katoptron]
MIFGLSTAWLMAMCKLPSERFLRWALVLPLVMPGYIVGYIFTDWLDFAGPIQILLRSLTGWKAGQYWFPDIRTLPGAIIVLALVFYPYVYLLCRAAFMEQSIVFLQTAKLLGYSPLESFFHVSLPLVRPSIIISLSLVAMETIGDFGTVSYFSVSTLTTAVYDTWLGYSSLAAAAKISIIMLFFVFIIMSIEQYSRRKKKIFQMQFNNAENFYYRLIGWKKWLALVWCWGLVSIAFFLPLSQLCIYAYHYFETSWTGKFSVYVLNSIKISVIAAFFCLCISLIINFCNRISPNYRSMIYMRVSSMGYAIPPTVLAIGVMASVLLMDRVANVILEKFNWWQPGLIFSSSIFTLIFAMVVRFSAVAIGSIESSLSKISPSLDMASRTMGCNSNQMLCRIHLPLVRRGSLIAVLLVFIESMKELNAGLLLRPFNFETLATYVFNYASDEHLELAALPAVLLVLVGIIPLMIINYSLRSKSTNELCIIYSKSNL